MAIVNIVQGDLQITGSLITGSYSTPITRSSLTEDSNAEYVLDWASWWVWDSGARLPNTSASDDLGLYPGTFGSASPSIRTYDVKNAGAVTLYARTMLWLPPEYITQGTVTIRLRAGMITTVASSSATVDCVCYKSDEYAGIGSDLVSTAAQSINSLSAADKDFVLDSTSLVAGDMLDLRVAVAVNDSATATAVIGCIGKASLLCDIKG